MCIVVSLPPTKVILHNAQRIINIPEISRNGKREDNDPVRKSLSQLEFSIAGFASEAAFSL
ncbi:MAG: hypothetical protein RR547_08985, partial [Raoultibacter sp.]